MTTTTDDVANGATAAAAAATAASSSPSPPAVNEPSSPTSCITLRGVFLLASAFITFSAFTVLVITEAGRFHPSWFPQVALQGSMPEDIHRVCLWILLGAVPVTDVAAWVPTSTRSSRDTNQSTTMSPMNTFLIYQGVAGVLYASFVVGWVFCPSSNSPLGPSVPLCAMDYRTFLAVLAFIAEILVISSILALQVDPRRQEDSAANACTTAVPRSRRQRLVVMVNNFNNMLLIIGAVLLALSSEFTHRNGTEDLVDESMVVMMVDGVLGKYSISSGIGSLALCVTALFNTYGLGGVLSTKDGWKFYQPFTGGLRFMVFQAISWTCFGVGLFIQGLYLLSIVIVELELFVGAMAVAGLLFLISEIVMMMSLLVFKGKTDAKDEDLPAFQRRARALARESLGALYIGMLANLQWVPSALFFVLYGSMTSLPPARIVSYSLTTTFVEIVIVLSRSVATHLHNKDSKYGKLAHVSPYRFKYVAPQLVAFSIPGIATYQHYINGMEATLPLALLSAYFYVYVFSYRGNPQYTGSRMREDWMTGHSHIIETVSKYFDGKIIREAPLDPKQHYIMGFHPHGIMATTAMWLQFSQIWRDAFPGVHAHILSASVLHQIPWSRDVLQYFGAREVTRQAFSLTLEEKKSVMLVPGGQAEMLEQQSGQKEVRVYTHHKGFIRLAIEYGVPLVPILSFKEGETMDNVKAPIVQRWFVRKLAFPFPYFPYGRFLLPIPRKVGLAIAVGAPLTVEQKLKPTAEDVDAVHAQYFARIREMFEKHKDEAGCSDYKLVLI
ncbi:hypothetical protein PINS_up003796 [Pythium insidiosum]|nr:hypothetical protein PINS_up003796 [Pythium insidiosum]